VIVSAQGPRLPEHRITEEIGAGGAGIFPSLRFAFAFSRSRRSFFQHAAPEMISQLQEQLIFVPLR
jgi:hypothetical protein